MTFKGREARPGLWRSRWAAVGAAIAVTLGGGGFFVASAAEPGPATAYHAVAPTRAIDTRDGTGVRAGMVGPGETLTFSFVGVAGVPAGTDSVAINLTVVGGTEASFLTVFPAGEPLPVASSINWPNGDAVANELTLKLGADGALNIFNSVGSVHVIVDVVGYLTPMDELGSSGQKGQTGDKGATGDQGPPGDKGDKGATGNKGATGDAGPDGLPGAQGPTGDKGATGDAGAPGADGAPGAQGPTGDKGETGDKGATGDAGAPGADGAQGPTGDKGETGDKGTGDAGVPGADGAQGPTGDKGETGDKGATGDAGAPGADGAPGAQGPVGDQGPVGNQGPVGLPGSAATITVRTNTGNATAANGGITASCIGTERAIGGGALAPSTANNSRLNSSSPVMSGADPTGWRAEWHGTSGGTPDSGTYTVYAICAV